MTWDLVVAYMRQAWPLVPAGDSRLVDHLGAGRQRRKSGRLSLCDFGHSNFPHNTRSVAHLVLPQALRKELRVTELANSKMNVEDAVGLWTVPRWKTQIA